MLGEKVPMKKTYIFGIHAVASVLKKNPSQLEQVYLIKNPGNKRLLGLKADLAGSHVQTQFVHQSELEQLVGDVNHQGVVAMIMAKLYQEADLWGLLDGLEVNPFLLILDGVQDPHNLGACLRTANAVGVHAVIAPKDNAVGMTPAVRKVASGAAEATPYIQVTNLARVIKKLQESGVWVYGLSDKAEKSLYQMDLKGPKALVMGAEGTGLRRLTEESCDVLLRIPMLGEVESLNVSVAAGVCLYECLRQGLL